MRVKNIICTVGTSLLGHLNKVEELREALVAGNWRSVVKYLLSFDPADQTCGAEINSLYEMKKRGMVDEANLHLLYSDTGDGRMVAEVLREYYRLQGWKTEIYPVRGLTDEDPRRFRTEGLRNLVRVMGKIIRDYGSSNCLINATGGYKAQIAVGVMLGQALGISVFYKHERFAEIISFPPLPFSLDFDLWQRYNHLFFALHRNDMVPERELLEDDEWDEKLESLVEREEIEGENYLALSPAGEIFHQTFCFYRLEKVNDFLPPSLPPELKEGIKISRLPEHNWPDRERVMRVMEKVHVEPFVRKCVTDYLNPDLPSQEGFRLERGEVTGIISNGTWTARFKVLTTATGEEEKKAVVEYLNSRWEKYFG